MYVFSKALKVCSLLLLASALIASIEANPSTRPKPSPGGTPITKRSVLPTPVARDVLDPRDPMPKKHHHNEKAKKKAAELKKKKQQKKEAEAKKARHHKSRASSKSHKHKTHHSNKVNVAEAGNGKKFHGQGTWFRPDHGACGSWDKASDYIVALSSDIFAGGKHCNQKLRICYGSKCVNAHVTDECPTCDSTSVDMSPAVFDSLANPDVGLIDISWSFT